MSGETRAHRNPMQRVVAAGFLLLNVVALALLCRWLALPWYCWALVWLFATKWTLLLILDLQP